MMQTFPASSSVVAIPTTKSSFQARYSANQTALVKVPSPSTKEAPSGTPVDSPGVSGYMGALKTLQKSPRKSPCSSPSSLDSEAVCTVTNPLMSLLQTQAQKAALRQAKHGRRKRSTSLKNDRHRTSSSKAAFLAQSNTKQSSYLSGLCKSASTATCSHTYGSSAVPMISIIGGSRSMPHEESADLLSHFEDSLGNNTELMSDASETELLSYPSSSPDVSPREIDLVTPPFSWPGESCVSENKSEDSISSLTLHLQRMSCS
eukprot:TRINITY_DN6996_c0_g1_i1.p1 TRINITY_DN6996_c0_g1~~TRINITY_DN6996_c0_g1_i1.p1  ORF type:complete len:261 (+),score=30.22 TRINITY_DN6996_c0_g1_i1:144-926(+)